MRSLTTIFALVLFFTSGQGSPSPLLSVRKFAGEVNPNSFIVKLKPGTDKAAHIAALQPHLDASDSQITYDYHSNFFNAFSGKFSTDTLNILRASPDVEYIEEDGIVYTAATVTQTDAPWGLSRLSQTSGLAPFPNATNFRYSYDSSGGSGVDIYIVDTGIFIEHSDFGGRARHGAVFGEFPIEDSNGHGTHVAGTAAGTRWGVAKAANLISVKVLDDRGTLTDILAGLDFVAASASTSGRPSVVNVSLAVNQTLQALDDACTALVNAGIHLAVGAGNEGKDAANTSPARAPAVNTVGATNIFDTRASFSNYGEVVDIFAPGQNITSTWITSPSSTASLSGTSMATPHVAGLIAYLIGLNGNVSPADMTEQLHTLGTDGILSGLPAGTRNELARNDIST